ncbi:haloalkane dehalogenase [Nocardioides sp. 1609]|uniref:haloalkane dehalogenase n=1 Tax=Nocardioides sp. 1609 TaxID=2508327 RepID=UPI00106FF03F|nr:haloalkane dehalogenase [Nocardioides sp. 1609]
MEAFRTPEDRFADLDWPEPAYAEVGDGLRMAYVDTGSPGELAAPVALLLHGEPTWGYLYRHVVAELDAAGVRCVVPDLIGFGRSDKPLAIGDHSYARHVEWVRSLVLDHLALTDVTLVGQDWGGLIGLRLVAEHPDHFARVVAANTGLPTGDVDMPEVWWRFRHAVESAPALDVGRLVASGCRHGLADADRAAYDAPFPDEASKAGPRAMPLLVPTRPDDPATRANRAAWRTLGEWDRPFLVAFSDSDPITAAMAPVLREHVPGAALLDHPTILDAGHFLQEDAGNELGRVVAAFMA